VPRILITYLLKAASVAVPLFLPWLVRVPGLDHLGEDADKKLGALVALSLLVILLVVDLTEHAVPRLRAQRVRDEYLDEIIKEHFRRGRKHLRFNVMMAKRRWYFLWLARAFHWTASKNFDPGQHHDARLWLGAWQGVAGRALAEEEVLFVDFRKQNSTAPPSWWPWNNPFKLTRWQIERTKNLVAILSVPILMRRGTTGNESYVAVGVFNIDAVSEEGANWLASKWPELKKPLMRVGTLVAAFGG
jgi:hypothetical protein